MFKCNVKVILKGKSRVISGDISGGGFKLGKIKQSNIN